MKSKNLKLSLIVILILITIFFEKIAPGYLEWKYITFVPVITLSGYLIYGNRISQNRLTQFYILLVVVGYMVFANITSPQTILNILIPILAGGVIALLSTFVFRKHNKA